MFLNKKILLKTIIYLLDKHGICFVLLFGVFLCLQKLGKRVK